MVFHPHNDARKDTVTLTLTRAQASALLEVLVSVPMSYNVSQPLITQLSKPVPVYQSDEIAREADRCGTTQRDAGYGDGWEA